MDIGGATTAIADTLPQVLGIIRALLPVLALGGITFAGVWTVLTAIDAVEKTRKRRDRRARTIVETAYMKLRAACEPETVDGAHNLAFLRADARDHVNQVAPLLRGGVLPEVCTTEEESLREWFALFAKLRMQRGMALLAADDLVRRRKAEGQ